MIRTEIQKRIFLFVCSCCWKQPRMPKGCIFRTRYGREARRQPPLQSSSASSTVGASWRLVVPKAPAEGVTSTAELTAAPFGLADEVISAAESVDARAPSPAVPAFFLLFCFLFSCQPQAGLKLSKKPTSSNRLGNNHRPGGTANKVTTKRINRKIDMAKNNPSNPSAPTDRYHTPCLMNSGQSGNSTAAKTAMRAKPAHSFVFHCEPSYNQT